MQVWEMTDGEIGRAYRLAKDPVTMVEVLAGLNDVSVSRMKKKLKSLGLCVPDTPKDARGKPWTAEEDALLARLMDAGYSTAAVARQMEGRSPKSVYNRWSRLQARFLAQRKAYDSKHVTTAITDGRGGYRDCGVC